MEIKNYIEVKKNGSLIVLNFPCKWDRSRFVSNFNTTPSKMYNIGETALEMDKDLSRAYIMDSIKKFNKLNGFDECVFNF